MAFIKHIPYWAALITPQLLALGHLHICIFENSHKQTDKSNFTRFFSSKTFLAHCFRKETNSFPHESSL